MDRFVSIGQMISEHASKRPEARALVFQDSSLSWAEWNFRLNRVVNSFFALGLAKKDTVAIVSDNSIEAFETFFGAIRAGICAVPLPTMASAETLRLMIDDSDAKMLFVSSRMVQGIAAFTPKLSKLLSCGCIGLDFHSEGWTNFRDWTAGAEEVAPFVEINPDDNFNIIYSSGTTGTPKGILHSHGQRSLMVLRADRWDFGPETVNLVSTPLYSNTTMAALLPTIFFGGTNLLMPKFDEYRFLELSQSEKVTHTMLVPVQYQRLLGFKDFNKYDLSSYRLKLCTSAPLRVETKREIVARWPGRLIDIYGLTEGGAVCLLDATGNPDKLHTVGRPSRLSEVRIIDEEGRELPVGEIGEIVGRQRVMMKEYYKKPDATKAIIWIDNKGNRFQRTGDIGRFDKDGYLQLLDRKKDVIISGGFNIYAADLETVLLQHEAVEDVVVIGIPSQRWGEKPLGLVVCKIGYKVQAEELRSWANQRLGRNQRLSTIEFRSSLPRNAAGKVLKRELRARYWKDTT